MPETLSAATSDGNPQVNQGTPLVCDHGHLPDELVVAILVRLPARSVCRFRAVSKSWHALATDTHVLRAHASRATSVPAVICSRTWWQRRPWQDMNVDFFHFNFFRDDAAPDLRGHDGGRSLCALNLNMSTRIVSWFVGSWDGVMCMEIRSQEKQGTPVDSYVLFNPLTRACVIVPAPAAARYGVVDGNPIWRDLPAPLDPDTAAALKNVYIKHGIDCRKHGMESFVNLHGKLHWIRVTNFGHSVQLLVFDKLKEEFGTMKTPAITVPLGFKRICEISGKLCIFYLTPPLDKMEMWVLEDYVEQRWKLKLSDTAALGVWYSSLPGPSFHTTAWIKMHRESLVPGELVFGVTARVVPETHPGIPLFLSFNNDAAFAVCPRIPLADVGKCPRGGIASSLWCSSYRIFLTSSGIMRRLARQPCLEFLWLQ
ncbi:hypothetical protein QOZ80_3AG0250930 [Eleusine coracana subsp. coracana]|nr:hypothetical protein QOZ80_3AG0250930 [Eleusine coracana subsp. coracana]